MKTDLLLESPVVHASRLEAEVLCACLFPEQIDPSLIARLDQGIVNDTLPSEAWRQLPYLCTVAPDLPFSAQARRTIASMQRHTLARSLVHLTLVSRTAEALHDRGMPVVTLKGLPLLDTVYPGASTRPAADADLLFINGETFAEYAPALEELGWSCRNEGTTTSQWRGSSGAEIDVHRFIRDWFCSSMLRADFVRDWRWVEGQRVRLPVPSAEALMMHVMLHGTLYSPSDTNSRWVLDAALLLRHTPDLDWQRVFELAAAHAWLAPIADCIELLCTLEQRPLPERLAELRAQERLPLHARLARARWLGTWASRSLLAHRVGNAIGVRSFDYSWGLQFPEHSPPPGPSGQPGYLGHLERHLETTNPAVGLVRFLFGGRRLRS